VVLHTAANVRTARVAADALLQPCCCGYTLEIRSSYNFELVSPSDNWELYYM
jgi:hypothetical protein